MKNQFVRIKPRRGSEKWINVNNIVAISEDVGEGLIKIVTNAMREGVPVSYVVESSVADFLSAIGVEEIDLS